MFVAELERLHEATRGIAAAHHMDREGWAFPDPGASRSRRFWNARVRSGRNVNQAARVR